VKVPPGAAVPDGVASAESGDVFVAEVHRHTREVLVKMIDR